MAEEVKVDIFKQTPVPLHVDLRRKKKNPINTRVRLWKMSYCLKFKEVLYAAFRISSCLFRIFA